MLSLNKRLYVLEFLRYFCKVQLLPADLSLQDCELRQGFRSPGRPGWIPKVFYVLFLTHTLHKSLSLPRIVFSTCDSRASNSKACSPG